MENCPVTGYNLIKELQLLSSLKCHIENPAPKKVGQTDENNFTPLPDECRDQALFLNVMIKVFFPSIDFKIWFFFLDFSDQVHDRHTIHGRVYQGKICYRHYTLDGLKILLLCRRVSLCPAGKYAGGLPGYSDLIADREYRSCQIILSFSA